MADRAANNILIASTILQLERGFEDGVTQILKESLTMPSQMGVKVIGSSD